MGAWGPGVYENDYALDLFYAEVKRLSRLVEKVLLEDPVDYADLDGPLLYVRMLALLVAEGQNAGLKPTTVEEWKRRYLHIFDATVDSPEREDFRDRRTVIVAEFDALASRLPRE